MMSRDIQQILLHWGGWSAGDHCSELGWSSIAAGFKGLVATTSRKKLLCSDEDGLVIDLCVAKLNIAGMARARSYIEDYYIKGMPKRAIGRKYKVREDEIRKQMQIGESFVFGCLEALNIQLDIDLIYGYLNRATQTLSRPQNLC